MSFIKNIARAKINRDAVEPVLIRYTAEYQLMSDYMGYEWANLTLVRAKINQEIEDFRVLSSEYGPWGLQLVTFTVDVNVPGEITYEDAKDYGEHLLNRIVGDSDVSVRWVTHLED